MLLEPIPVNGLTERAVQAIVKKDYFPDQFTVIPKNGDKETVDGSTLTWHAVESISRKFHSIVEAVKQFGRI